VVLTILKNMKVNGKDDIPYMKWTNKSHVPNHQPVHHFFTIIPGMTISFMARPMVQWAKVQLLHKVALTSLHQEEQSGSICSDGVPLHDVPRRIDNCFWGILQTQYG